MVDDVLMEFDGHLSITDIFNLTYKELDILRTHRRKHGQAYHANKQASQMFGGMVPGLSAPSNESNASELIPGKNAPPLIPGKYN